MKIITMAAAASLMAAPVFAQDSCPLSYDVFEIGVPHTDMDACPDSMQVEGAFCRLSLVAEVATIFAFSEQDDCIIATQAYFDDQYTLTLN
ncbi:hypothetical protein [Roseobacter sp. CCS2]|uniref:hypothetical protein n=1 Tax=Roseobacter sp. CCS2 TaxID=391593 RepID=UPI0000F3FDB7|nr:hypothetical protein [Roseobacter sp. CCS2]EBA10696.1 hypothetical protein RCCS2_02850 [Roseobacter sp. CCS2]